MARTTLNDEDPRLSRCRPQSAEFDANYAAIYCAEVGNTRRP
jgi:hypothetical protein